MRRNRLHPLFSIWVTFAYLFIIVATVDTATAREIVSDTEIETNEVNETNEVDLPVANRFEFKSGESKTVSGNASEPHSGFGCGQPFTANEILGNFSLAANFYQNGCYTDGKYNHRNYKLTSGIVKSSNQASFEAVQIEEPAHKAANFLASHHFLYYRPNEAADYYIYRFEENGGVVSKVGFLKKSDVTAGQFIKLPMIDASAIGGKEIYLVSKNQELSIYTQINDTTQGGVVSKTPIGNHEKRIMNVAGIPFDTVSGFNAGPETHDNIYGINRQFFFLTNTSPQIVYQNKTTGSVQLVGLDQNLLKDYEITLSQSNAGILAAAAADNAGNVYLLRVQLKSGVNRPVTIQKIAVNRVASPKVSATARIVKESQLNSSTQGLNVFKFSDDLSGKHVVSSMEWMQSGGSSGTLGIVLSRTMNKSSDGLNHQGAIAFTIDPESLAVVKNLGQTSGHSFGNFLAADGDDFIAVDLGDNYPRGVHLHRFNRLRKASRLVFTFKTQHGTTPKSPAGKQYPVYKEISKSGKTYYQWSNDNRVYTEIGGFAKTDEGYMVLFATEFPALDNSRVGNNLNDARNLGIVHIKQNFDTISQKGSIIEDAMMLFTSSPETASFYNFGGGKTDQRNTGVIQLTQFKTITDNASRPKMIRAGNNQNLILYEVWSAKAYKTTNMLVVNDKGKITSSYELGPAWRLNRQDDIYLYNDQIITLSGSKPNQSIEINSIKLQR